MLDVVADWYRRPMRRKFDYQPTAVTAQMRADAIMALMPAVAKYAVLLARRTRGRIRETSVALLIWGVLFGSIGIGYFMYGKSQTSILTMFCGVGLMVFPYFVSSVLWMLVIGAAFTLAPWYWR